MDIKHWKGQLGGLPGIYKTGKCPRRFSSLLFFFRENRSTFCSSPLGVAASEKGLGLGAGGAAASEEAEESLADPEDGDDGECQSGPVDECGRPLVVKHGEEAPGDSDAAGEVSLGGRERVGGRGGLEEEQGQEDEDLGEDASAVTLSVYAKRVKGSEEAQECGESVPQGEGEMDPKLVVEVLGDVILLDNVEHVRDSRGDE